MSTQDKKDSLLYNLKNKFESVQKFLEDLIQENAQKLSNLVETNFQLGLYHLRANNLRDAEFRFRIVLYFRPEHHRALYNLAKCYIAKKQKSLAIEKVKMALKINPDFPEALYLLGALEKSTKVTEIPLTIIEEYYNNLAASYDNKFNASKGYKIPEYIADLLAIHYESKKKDTKILDLGCGTGRMSKALSETISYDHMVGVDISKNMLQKAQYLKQDKSALFDKLVHVDFHQFLEKTQSKFNLVVAAMSLHFQEDLEKQLKQIYKVLDKNGYVAFSVEQAKLHNHSSINPSYENFVYSKNYVKESIEKAHFSSVLLDTIDVNNKKSILVCICKK